MEDRDMKESEIIVALQEIDTFLFVVSKVLKLPQNGETARGLVSANKMGDKAESNVLSLCKYVADSGDQQRLKRLRGIGEQAAALMLEDWPLSEPRKGWQARYCLLHFSLEYICGTVQSWCKDLKEDDGSQDKTSAVIIDEETEKELRSLFPNNELGKRQAKIFVRGIKKIAESPKPSARKYAMLLAHTFIATPTLYNTTTFTDLCQKFQKILNVKVMSYKNKPDSLAKEWLKK